MPSSPADETPLDPSPVDEPVAPAPARRRRLLVTLVSLTLGVLVVDQLTKVWALHALDDGLRRTVLGDLLGLQLVFNPGAALSLGTGVTWLLTIIAAAVVVVVVRASRRLGSTLWSVALGLLLGGALGNLLDRLFREPGVARGHVVDFIAYGDWFVGNVADIAIVVAAALIVLLAAAGVRMDGSRETAKPAQDESARDESARDESARDESAQDESARDDSALDAPALDQHAADPPTADPPTADRPAPGRSHAEPASQAVPRGDA